ncbi:DUF4097 family beta strand repeat-containing protein [Clostridium sp. AL.422]|uniref:DUF4097 family beta strand repeat-containing protein n=1 Tax=Clostridium TaxID=1485 RepID=UPI00293DE8DD|nr:MULTISPECIES: DUF4097 family beta strand repeat-containing protein [unclassified Clostridium]MDV4151457.1 DUF4097 family beta strand repeat-containing protein [Clostridium sp. AL.422]
MKKIINIVLAITLTSLLGGCGIRFGIESRRGSWNTDNSTGSYEKVDISEDMNEISKLDISISVSNVKINYYDGSDIKISGNLSKYSKGIKTERKSDKLIIIEESEKTIKVMDNSKSDLTIDVPRSFNGDLDLDLGVGEYEINDLVLNNVDIENGVGDLTLNEISFNELDLESGVGNTTLETSKKTGEISIKGGIGETNVSLGDINGNLKFEGGVGSARIRVPDNAPINITSSSGLGDAKIKAKTSGDAKYTFDLEVGIGDVEVTN